MPPPPVARRDFVKLLSAAGLALGAAPVLRAAPSGRARYAIVGTGSRSRLYQDAIETTFRADAELVAVCDVNPGRLEVARRRSAQHGVPPPPAYAPADFERMIAETRPDHVIVTSIDATHDDYIVRALDAGVDVICEKPLANTGPKVQRILDATARTGRRVRVTFNYRYSPPRTQVKDLLMQGAIGDILSVDFHWLLNTHHGADYFRRWHSHRAVSQGLLLHKASHHFDLVNWWLGAVPETVWAEGKRAFYTPKMARRFGLAGAHARCHTCPEQARCGFFLDLAASPELKELYLDQEHHDGYFRDQCVFREEIDIEDTMNVIVQYDTGATLSYSLNAFNAWEGYHIAFNGTKGRLEHRIVETTYVNGTGTVQGGIAAGGVTTRVIPLRGPAREVAPWTGEGGHGGGDAVMLAEIFRPGTLADRYRRASTEHAGAAAALVGIAANRSFVTGGSVRVADLVTGFQRPAYAPMPGPDEPVPMPDPAARPV